MAYTSRRDFVKKSALVAAGAGLSRSVSYGLTRTIASSDRINVGVIGVGFGIVNMRRMLDGNPGVHCNALCDVDRAKLDSRAGELKVDYPDRTGSLALYTDFRRLLDDQEMDGVIIATPDHWIGSNGTLVCNRTGYEVIPQRSNGRPVIPEIKMQGPYGNQYNHMINWAECIRDGNVETNSPVEKGSHASLIANIANISYRTGSRRLEYLPDAEAFHDNSEADAFIAPEYHNGWEYPQE